jgi:uncharacterized protein Yka (UPF0111/DUF47 family)
VGYSTDEKRAAAEKLQKVLNEYDESAAKSPQDKNTLKENLTKLEEKCPALRNGRLGKLFKAYHEIAATEVIKEELASMDTVNFSAS